MTTTYPIIETQLRLIRALQKGYVEALEAGDWQAANYRCFHLHKLCEGLHHLSQLLDRERSIPEAVPQKSLNGMNNSWVSSIRATAPINNSLSPSPDFAEKPVVSPPPPPEPTRYEWGIGFQGIDPPPIDEVW